MKIYIVLEQSPRGTRISKVFAKVSDAVAWRMDQAIGCGTTQNELEELRLI